MTDTERLEAELAAEIAAATMPMPSSACAWRRSVATAASRN